MLCAQGSRVKNETVVLTVHDLGCSGAHAPCAPLTRSLLLTAHLCARARACAENELMEVLRSREMRMLATRIVWVHVLVPGQESHSFDLPTECARATAHTRPHYANLHTPRPSSLHFSTPLSSLLSSAHSPTVHNRTS